jgi:hypothetical protein
VTADSFIVYLERIRDEVREGRPLVAAVEAGGRALAARSWPPTQQWTAFRCLRSSRPRSAATPPSGSHMSHLPVQAAPPT